MPFKTLRKLILPQDSLFFDLMLKQAQTAHATALALRDLFENYSLVPTKVERIHDLEHQGDQLVREVYTGLHTTFIVPIDHSDISLLAGSLDDIIDIIDHTASTMIAYRIGQPTPEMKHLAELLTLQTEELQKAVVAVSTPKTYSKAAEHCNKIKSLEDKSDSVYTAAIGELFKSKDAIEVIRQKDILYFLETSTDKVDKAAQIVSDIMVKHA